MSVILPHTKTARNCRPKFREAAAGWPSLTRPLETHPRHLLLRGMEHASHTPPGLKREQRREQTKQRKEGRKEGGKVAIMQHDLTKTAVERAGMRRAEKE